jgi:hypothetical protein
MQLEDQMIWWWYIANRFVMHLCRIQVSIKPMSVYCLEHHGHAMVIQQPS